MNTEIKSGILGLTITETGRAIQPVLPVVAKIGIGRPKGYQDKSGNILKAPKKLDHFVFLREETQEIMVEGKKKVQRVWVDDLALAELYGERCREIDVVLLDNNPMVALKNFLEKWATGGLVCRGNKMEATRMMEKVIAAGDQKETWQRKDEAETIPCSCEFFDDGSCKPVGTLYCMLPAKPTLGAVTKVQTTSYNTIRNLFSGMVSIKAATCTTPPMLNQETGELTVCDHGSNLCNGRLAGIPLKLVVRPQAANPTVKGKKMSVLVYTMHLEYRPNAKDVFAALIAEDERLTGRKALVGKIQDVEETPILDDDETREAADILGHFHEDEPAQEIVESATQPIDEAIDPWADDQQFIDEINAAMPHISKAGNTGKLTGMIKDAGGTNITDIPPAARKAFIGQMRKLTNIGGK